MKKITILLSVIAVAVLFVGFSIFKADVALGDADFAGGQARVATSSTIVVGTTQNKTLFAANDLCAARIISTVAQPIMLSFDSAVTPSATVGHVQAASTTVAYDSAHFGCGAVTAYGLVASTTITTAEARW